MNITGTQLAMQYELAVAWWPFLHDVEREYGLPPFLLFAVGSRETNLDPYYVDHPGDSGHGRGLWQLDDRYHDIPDPFPVELQAVKAAELLQSLLEHEGLTEALNRYNSGSPLTSRTTGKDYGPDVAERREWLVAHYPYPPFAVHREPTKEITMFTYDIATDDGAGQTYLVRSVGVPIYLAKGEDVKALREKAGVPHAGEISRELHDAFMGLG